MEHPTTLGRRVPSLQSSGTHSILASVDRNRGAGVRAHGRTAAGPTKVELDGLIVLLSPKHRGVPEGACFWADRGNVGVRARKVANDGPITSTSVQDVDISVVVGEYAKNGGIARVVGLSSSGATEAKKNSQATANPGCESLGCSWSDGTCGGYSRWIH